MFYSAADARAHEPYCRPWEVLDDQALDDELRFLLLVEELRA